MGTEVDIAKVPRARGRPRGFDLDAVLDAAMTTFWRKGYAAASLDDLTEAMGIPRSSFYLAFKGKEPLFRRVIEHYASTRLAPLVAALEPNGESLEASLRAFCRHLVDLVTGDSDPPGCLVTCVLADCAGDDPAMRALLTARFEALEADLAARFARAKEEGDLRPDTDAGSLAAVFAAVARGLTVSARAGAPRRELERTAMIAVATICAAHGGGGIAPC